MKDLKTAVNKTIISYLTSANIAFKKTDNALVLAVPGNLQVDSDDEGVKLTVSSETVCVKWGDLSNPKTDVENIIKTSVAVVKRYIEIAKELNVK